ncbi:sigma-70 family RNA polymerase sigma factor [Amycolatopsis rhizosphaerae]|uniref:Sigma-70 family RNA polymerase sigma factor n=1 Tax=Amycolatopsis rhizosphaerae TaxID=2053003 RepID=A0A558D1W6_9PSEU|nr:sigma-70 family RNA polymerase sigma factor [Amycolatopsis rhizosphaerae]TVT54953.1 sigma-70 family RNA polymerase sigma factor [Amycolatopsis rhizosphaerae]
MAERQLFTQVARERAVSWRRVAFLMCGDWVQAEDIVQMALIRLARHWHRIDLAGVEAYARKVIARLVVDGARRSRHLEELQAFTPDQPVMGPNSDEVLDIREALRHVPPRQRAVLVLRFYCDLTVAQTAAALDINEGTVKSQTARGLDTLRSFLRDAQPAFQASRLQERP